MKREVLYAIEELKNAYDRLAEGIGAEEIFERIKTNYVPVLRNLITKLEKLAM